jgi:hypothetical protein
VQRTNEISIQLGITESRLKLNEVRISTKYMPQDLLEYKERIAGNQHIH